MDHNYHTLYNKDNYHNNFDNNILDENRMSIIFYNGIYYLFSFLMIGASGLSIAIICVSVFLYSDYLSYKNTISDFSNSNSDSDSDSDSSELYEEKYMNEYEELETIKLEDDDINKLKDLFILNRTPKSLIKMCYDKDTNAFLYYADSKDISYKYLETVGRFYVIEKNCKMLFVNS
jgi:hypothetical protein